MDVMDEVWVITWRYSDDSGHGIVRGYEKESEAQLDLAMLREHAQGRLFEIVNVPLMGS